MLEQFIYHYKTKIRSVLRTYPRIYTTLVGLRDPAVVLGVNKARTDLVIEGYPRSGNTFAWCAFMIAQTYPFEVAHHSHSVARIIQAVKLDIPTLVLIRPPRDCVLSYSIYASRQSLKTDLKDWITFYSTIEPYRDGFVVAPFDEVTYDFGRVITKVNSRFNTEFQVFEHSEENVQQVFEIIRIRSTTIAKRTTNKGDVENIGIPTKSREHEKSLLAKRFGETQTLSSLLTKAQRLYERYVAIERRTQESG